MNFSKNPVQNQTASNDKEFQLDLKGLRKIIFLIRY